MTATWLFVAGIVLAPIAGLFLFALWTARRAEAAVPPPGHFIIVEGVRLHYLDIGTGPVVVMIHGLASQLQTFTFALSGKLPGYRLVMLDRPGSGYSQAWRAAGLGAQADIVAAFLRALEIDKALVVGHSLGGAVSLALALDHPDRVAALALLAPATQFQTDPPKALRGLAIRSDRLRWIVAWTVALPASLRASAQTTAALFGPDPVPADFGTRGGAFLTLRPWAFRNASRDLAGVAYEIAAYAARYGQLDMLVGVLFGTDDRILDPRLHGESLVGRIERLDLEFIEGGGHMVPLSNPERSAALIERIAAKAEWIQEVI